MRAKQQAILTHSSTVWHRQRATTELLFLVVATLLLLLLLLACGNCTARRWYGWDDAGCFQSIVHRDAASCLSSMLLLLLLLVWVLQFSCMF
jgi:uncharacterized integral membrane protein